jgi:hypothetical protein
MDYENEMTALGGLDRLSGIDNRIGTFSTRGQIVYYGWFGDTCLTRIAE